MLIDPTNKVTQEGQILETHGIHWLKKKLLLYHKSEQKSYKRWGKIRLKLLPLLPWKPKKKMKAAEHDWWILMTNYSSVKGCIQVKVAHDSQWSINFILVFYTSFNNFFLMEILRNTAYVYWKKKLPLFTDLSFSLFLFQGNYKKLIHSIFKEFQILHFFLAK